MQSGLEEEARVKDLLAETAVRAARYAAAIGGRRVSPLPENVARLAALGALPQRPCHPAEVLALLDEIGSPATVSAPGRPYFGFVIGGPRPAQCAATGLRGAVDRTG